ncbi:MAG TPA: hypothetical protein VJR89_34035 [Polyangiales bacterium]|nr:hypothetical protein [Polyangiales bacterium]
MDAMAVTGAARLGARAAWCTLIGILTSGPLALLALQLWAAQPAWTDAESFAAHYHPAQSLPYLAGFLLVAGYVMLIASLHALATPSERATSAVGLAFCSAYAALVLCNYMLQTAYVPELARHYEPANAPLIGMWSMVQPRSIAWGLELWGYGCLGIATWAVAPVLARHGARGRSAAWTFRANGVVSVASALWTILQPGWAQTAPGIVAFVLWNILAFAMSWLALGTFRSLERTQRRPSTSGVERAPAPIV